MRGELSWIEFVAGVEALGTDTAEPGFDPERHAAGLAALAARLDLEDPALAARFDALEPRRVGDYVTAPVTRTDTIGVMRVNLRAGGRVGLHDHPRQSGFILCCAGRVEVDAFDVATEVPLRLRRVFEGTLGPGDTASLTPQRGNVHRLSCPTATRLVDVFTPPTTDAIRHAGRSFAQLEETEPGTFAARLTAEREG